MARLEDLTREFLTTTRELNPEVTTFQGATGPEDGLPDPSPDGIRAKCDFVRVFRERFAAFERASLTPAQRLDVEVFTRSADVWLYGVEMLGTIRHNPDPLEEIGFLLFTQTRRASVDPETRFRDVAARLAGFNLYLDRFHRRIEVADRHWTELAHRVAATFPAFLETIRDSAEGVVSAPLEHDLRHALARAHEAVENHAAWLHRIPVREGLWRLDPERFGTLLRLRGLEASPDEIEAEAREALRAFREERDRRAREITPDGGAEAARRRLRKDHAADFARVLEEVRGLVAEARDFVADHELCTLRDWERFEIEPTPPFFRALIPTASYFSPARLDREQVGTYAMTPPAAPSLLEEYSRSALPLVAVHEAYPGHHHHTATANRIAGPLREGGTLGFPADAASWFGSELVEGWAYYAEASMLEHGFHDRPEVRFQFADKMLRRAARTVADVDLALGRMSVEETAAELNRVTGRPIAYTPTEVMRYTRSPGLQLGHLLGKTSIEGWRDRCRAAEGERFSLRRFHDRILEAGTVPVTLLETHYGRNP